MGEVHAVTLNNDPTGPDEPQEAVEPQEAQPEAAIPEKFRDADTGEVNVEALLASYNQLEKKLGEGEPEVQDSAEPEQEEAEEAEEVEEAEEDKQAPSGEALSKFSEEFYEKGELSEESFTALETMGYPRDLVESFIQGQQALVTSEQDRLYSEVGGADAYSRMSDWASVNMTDEAKVAYNEAVQSGNMEQATLAVRGLRDSYMRAEGQQPNLIQGRSSGEPSLKGFRSTAELVQAMRDPRYKNDPAYREDVETRLRNSKT